jgi:hypothetical protein
MIKTRRNTELSTLTVRVFAGARAIARPALLTLLTSPSATLFFPVIAGAFAATLSDDALLPGADETDIDDLLFVLAISHKSYRFDRQKWKPK